MIKLYQTPILVRFYITYLLQQHNHKIKTWWISSFVRRDPGGRGFSPETALPTQGTDSRWETVEKSPTSGTGSMELGRIFQSLLPSGNLLHSYWTWPIYSGFTHEKWLFSIVMLVYRSLLCFFFPVKHGKPHWKNAMNFPVQRFRVFPWNRHLLKIKSSGINGKRTGRYTPNNIHDTVYSIIYQGIGSHICVFLTINWNKYPFEMISDSFVM